MSFLYFVLVWDGSVCIIVFMFVCAILFVDLLLKCGVILLILEMDSRFIRYHILRGACNLFIEC